LAPGDDYRMADKTKSYSFTRLNFNAVKKVAELNTLVLYRIKLN